jgi:RNA recognition motif-containing protein
MYADQEQAPSGVQAVASEAPAEQGIKVFAGNLAYATDDAALKAFFAPVESDIISVHVIMRGHRSAGYGFVTVTTQSAAEQAVAQLDKQELDGRPVIVEVAKPNEQRTKVRTEKRERNRAAGRRGDKAVPGEVTEAEANGEVAPARIDDAPAGGDGTAAAAEGPTRPRKKKSNKKRRGPKRTDGQAGSADGVQSDDAPANGTEDVGPTTGETRPRKTRKPRPSRPRPPRTPRGEVPPGAPSKTVLFVANLAFEVDDDALTKVFSDAGITVSSARVIRRRWGTPRRSKGYGFVDVGSEEEQQKAIEAVSGKEVEGREITVRVAVDAPVHHDDGGAEGAVPDADAPAGVAA